MPKEPVHEAGTVEEQNEGGAEENEAHDAASGRKAVAGHGFDARPQTNVGEDGGGGEKRAGCEPRWQEAVEAQEEVPLG